VLVLWACVCNVTSQAAAHMEGRNDDYLRGYGNTNQDI
jgi:hypothetical protein